MLCSWSFSQIIFHHLDGSWRSSTLFFFFHTNKHGGEWTQNMGLRSAKTKRGAFTWKRGLYMALGTKSLTWTRKQYFANDAADWSTQHTENIPDLFYQLHKSKQTVSNSTERRATKVRLSVPKKNQDVAGGFCKDMAPIHMVEKKE